MSDFDFVFFGRRRARGDCPQCGGDYFFRACGGMGGRRTTKRCRCGWRPMARVAYAFEWVAYFIAVTNNLEDALSRVPER